MTHPAMWSDPYLLSVSQALTDWHGWLLAGWLGFSLLVAVVVGGGGK